jgi:hypothetical protein
MWDNDLIQFARLICEINATQENLDWIALLKEMDITANELGELFDRAHEVWETFKTEGGE